MSDQIDIPRQIPKQVLNCIETTSHRPKPDGKQLTGGESFTLWANYKKKVSTMRIDLKGGESFTCNVGKRDCRLDCV